MNAARVLSGKTGVLFFECMSQDIAGVSAGSVRQECPPEPREIEAAEWWGPGQEGWHQWDHTFLLTDKRDSFGRVVAEQGRIIWTLASRTQCHEYASQSHCNGQALGATPTTTTTLVPGGASPPLGQGWWWWSGWLLLPSSHTQQNC